jgi:hypothetical protein
MLMAANNRQQVIQKAHLEFDKDELKIGGINLLIYLHYIRFVQLKLIHLLGLIKCQ